MSKKKYVTRLKNLLKSPIIVKMKNLLYNIFIFLPEMFGGLGGYILSEITIRVFILNNEQFIFFINWGGVILGSIFTHVIIDAIRYRDVRHIVKLLHKTISDFRRKTDNNNCVEWQNKVITYHVEKSMDEVKSLFSAGMSSNLADYEKYIELSLDVLSKDRSEKLNILGTCTLLPEYFDQSHEYSNLWFDKNQYFNKRVRILCDHTREGLTKSIENHKNKFIDFCTWNKDTNFKLFIFKGNYDKYRKERHLQLNDFFIVNDLYVMGADVPSGTISTEQTVNKLSINFELNNYTSFFKKIMDNKRQCREVQLNSKSLYEDTLNFLKSN